MKKRHEEALYKVKSTRPAYAAAATFPDLYYRLFFPIIYQLAMAFTISNILGLLQFSTAEDWQRAIHLGCLICSGAPLMQLAPRSCV